MISVVSNFFFEKQQIIKFFLVGLLGNLLGLAIIFMITEFLEIFYLYSQVFAFFLVLTFNFTLNRRITFEKSQYSIKIEYFKYLQTNFIAFLISILTAFILVTFLNLWYLFAIAVSILISFIGNFILTKLYVYATRKQDVWKIM